MANPGGTNQFQGFRKPVPYGDKQKQGDLARSAPLAGAAGTASVLNTPRRDGRQAVQPAPPLMPGEDTPLAPGVSASVVLQQISQIPGVTPTWHELPG